jgi:hypothetical protein
MKKHFPAVLAALLLAAAFLCPHVTPSPTAAAPEGALPFTDVADGDWFYGDVLAAWQKGLIHGITPTRYVPEGTLSYAEAVKLAAAVHQLCAEGSVTIPAVEGSEWYLPYADYCRAHGIPVGADGWNDAILRWRFMELFAAALPPETDFPNDIPDGAIPDLDGVPENGRAAVYRLYRAGVVQGMDGDHACAPMQTITRAEAAAILTRMTDGNARIRFTMLPPGPQIEVRDGVTYVNGILIVNKTYSLPPEYDPGGLLAECAAAYRALCEGAKAEGLLIYAVSGYRSYAFQKQLYANYAARDGYALADRYSARAGHSEHQTGLAIDVNSVLRSFANTAEGKWLAAHCHEYGFILRYPEGKEDVTGFMYEPWHIRYLGVETATRVAASGLTLEEYLGITSVYAD